MGVEIPAMRPIIVEDLTRGEPKGPDRSFAEHVASVSGSAAGKKNENLRNVGPSVEYKLIDEAGQAHEFQNYMLPMELDGASVFLAGVRNNASEPFRYLRIPADDDSSIAEFMRLRATLADPAARQEAARRFAERNSPSGADRQPLQTAAERALETFATGGLQAVAAFLQANTPAADLERLADGRANWVFTLPETGEPSPWVLDINEIGFDKGRVGLVDEILKADLTVLVDPLGKPVPFADVAGSAFVPADGAAPAPRADVFGWKVDGKMPSSPFRCRRTWRSGVPRRR
ncbi:hypothetical protein G6F31_015573 [Rhizopus arrhizus]|nr:hypothetical protein G6F31_015573 [Rhizopus arrhizus]